MEFRASVRNFLKKHGVKLLLFVIIVLFILTINMYFKYSKRQEPISTKIKYSSVINRQEKVTPKEYNFVNNVIDQFILFCQSEEYEKAYDMISEDCKKNIFPNIDEFKRYAMTNFPKQALHETIFYSRAEGVSIYQVKVFNDFLKSGLTREKLTYIDLKMSMVNENGKKKLNVAGYMGSEKLASVFENQYIKVDIVERRKFYSTEIYNIKIKNRTEYDLIIETEDGSRGIFLDVGIEQRKDKNNDDILRLGAYATKTFYPIFSKFVDSKESSKNINIPNIKFVKNVDGKKEVVTEFSVNLPIRK